MLALGLTDSEIGLLTSIGLGFQVFWAMISGAITDKLGRKRTTFIFDAISWSIPALIWAVSQNFTHFLIAAIINSVWRVTYNSWSCLLVEDTDPDLLVDVYSWIYISGLLAAFVSPLTGVLIDRFSLIPTMRGLYGLAFVMMTTKFIATNAMVTETKQGLVRMEETRGQSLFAILKESLGVLSNKVMRAPITLLATGLMLVLGISRMITSTFWSILVTKKLQIPAEHLALYPFARSMTMLLFFFLIMPRVRHMKAHRAMILGFLGTILGHVILVSVPAKNYLLLLLATVLEACSVPMTGTLLDKLVVLAVDAEERARIMAMLNMSVIVLTSPFGWIAGQISEIDRNLPFFLNIALFTIGVLLAYVSRRWVED
jgi:Na+/melibiose symporter-like transporter